MTPHLYSNGICDFDLMDLWNFEFPLLIVGVFRNCGQEIVIFKEDFPNLVTIL
jgi:hypothetical protein